MLNQKTLSKVALVMGSLIVIMTLIAFFGASYAAGEEEAAAQAATNSVTAWKALASAIAIGIAACGGAIGMAISTGKTVESIARQPEADGQIRTNFMLGLVFIETAIIYALLVVILIIFVL